jgi:predicted DNA-binding transcriptional regulator AlpA
MATPINPENDRLLPHNASLNSLLTEYDVARILNVSVATIRRRRLLKQAPVPVRVGASVRYRPEEISRFIESNTSNSHLGSAEGR